MLTNDNTTVSLPTTAVIHPLGNVSPIVTAGTDIDHTYDYHAQQ